MSYGYYLAALYESGFRLVEDEDDRSPYSPTGNVCNAIMQDEPTKHGHGRLQNLSLEPSDEALTEGRALSFVLLRALHGDTVRPVYFRKMRQQIEPHGPAECVGHFFGFQFTDPETGRNVQHVEVFR